MSGSFWVVSTSCPSPSLFFWSEELARADPAPCLRPRAPLKYTAKTHSSRGSEVLKHAGWWLHCHSTLKTGCCSRPTHPALFLLPAAVLRKGSTHCGIGASSPSSSSHSSARPRRRLVKPGVPSRGHIHEPREPELPWATHCTGHGRRGAGVSVDTGTAAHLLYAAVRPCAGWEAWVDEQACCCSGQLRRRRL
jgi:hypothetical protein